MPHYGSIVWETVGRRVEISAKVGATARSTSLVAESERNRKSEKGREREKRVLTSLKEGGWRAITVIYKKAVAGANVDGNSEIASLFHGSGGHHHRHRSCTPIPPPPPLMPLRRFPSKSNVPRDRESDDARWKTMGVVGKSDRKGGGGVKAGIGNVPKLLYRRSIYGDEKHSLPSTPVAPAQGSRQPRSVVSRLCPSDVGYRRRPTPLNFSLKPTLSPICRHRPLQLSA